jgi:hypothetical protein
MFELHIMQHGWMKKSDRFPSIEQARQTAPNDTYCEIHAYRFIARRDIGETDWRENRW